MANIFQKNHAETSEREENVIAGIVGAFLFSLAGAAVWVVLDIAGFIAGLSGLVGAFCAIQGYRIFGGRLSKKGVIIAAVISLVVLVLAWYGCIAKDFYIVCKQWYAEGELMRMPTYFDCLMSVPELLQDKALLQPYLTSLLMGILFAVIGSLRYVINAFKSVDANKNQMQQAQGQYGEFVSVTDGASDTVEQSENALDRLPSDEGQSPEMPEEIGSQFCNEDDDPFGQDE